MKSEDGIDLDKVDPTAKEMIDQLKFDKVHYIDGYSEKVINFSFCPAEIGQFRFSLQLYMVNFLYSPPITIYFKS